MTNNADKSILFLTAWRIFAPNQPEPVPEYKFMANRKFRFDFAYPDNFVAVEIDGGEWKPFGGRHGHDRIKRNFAAELGWRVLYYSPDMLTRKPEECIAQVIRTLTHD